VVLEGVREIVKPGNLQRAARSDARKQEHTAARGSGRSMADGNGCAPAQTASGKVHSSQRGRAPQAKQRVARGVGRVRGN
jgi:hypothetical protein